MKMLPQEGQLDAMAASLTGAPPKGGCSADVSGLGRRAEGHGGEAVRRRGEAGALRQRSRTFLDLAAGKPEVGETGGLAGTMAALAATASDCLAERRLSAKGLSTPSAPS